MSTFEKLAAIDCSKHVEKKGKFSYLSWPFAVRMLREHAPDATWEVKRFDGLPYQRTDAGTFVEVAVTVEGVTLSQIHPVLNHANKVVMTPDAFAINTSLQRALVKAIALHGLGLYVYAGEDLPEGEAHAPIHPASDVEESLSVDQQTSLKDEAQTIAKMVADKLPKDAMAHLERLALDPEAKVYVWKQLDSKTRAALKGAK